jgi:hypothetical protein
VRIRHFGFLASRRRGALLPVCKQALSAIPLAPPQQQLHQINRHSFFPSGFAHCAAVPWPSSNDLRPFRSGSVLHQPPMKRNRPSNIQRLSERARFVCAHSSHSNRTRFSLHCRTGSKSLAGVPPRSITSGRSRHLQFINIRTAVPIPQPQVRPIQNP